MSLLRVRDLTVAFGRRPPVVRGISFDVEPGQRVGLIGESGCGKTVTSLAVMGLLPDNARISGSIRLGDVEVVGSSDRAMSELRGDELTMIFQEPMTALDPTMRCGRQVAEVLRLHSTAAPGAARERVLVMLGEVGFADPERIANSFPHELSGGQRQRVVTAMALINSPDLVICDEPTTALDVTVQATVLKLLDRVLASQNAACLFISHDLAVVSELCSDVLVMLDGEIVERGTASGIFTDAQHPYTKGLVATSRLDLVEPGSRLPLVEDFYAGAER
ncbi:ABC transporter ATP-binding protein [Propioniciclava tarda]|uniref:ABC transporter ATP-binding protein n=1 Tax=Propioniciclava tarda TaxID=433330 RepID=A0A4Q9KKZ3_PROTD|nr:ABC transporter ATP-binding protein [Propioniciclava tarda]TBT95176.1 ABC transporter ATP-binding protein [Propioniciclava tarda]SMO51647.1 ABC-type dipeptide/oligopeptide/nickel transport system, ATPase component [Propioniciclava tarda]